MHADFVIMQRQKEFFKKRGPQGDILDILTSASQISMKNTIYSCPRIDRRKLAGLSIQGTLMNMRKKSAGGSGLVYSTEHGRTCPTCEKPVGQCSCGQKKSPAKGDSIVRVLRETKGRKGSGVTLITGLPLAESELAALARQLKQRCGSGGTVKNGVIEVQGDQREVVLAELIRLGFQAKKAGG